MRRISRAWISMSEAMPWAPPEGWWTMIRLLLSATRMRTRLNTLYAKYTGQAIEEIEKAMDRDKFMESDEAKTFGIIDEVFDKRPDAGEDAGTSAGDVTPS